MNKLNDRLSFEEWMEKVDGIVIRKYGISVYDLPDCSFNDWYEDDVSPLRAAERVIREGGGEL